MKHRYLLFFIPVGLLLPLIMGGALLLGTAHPELLAHSLQGNAMSVSEAFNMNQIDAQQCYTDPHVQNIAPQSANAGDGRVGFALAYCPSQNAFFGRFGLYETNQPLKQGGCFYIQNDLTLHGQGGFEGGCSPQYDPGDIQTSPAFNDGHPWQACWIDYSVVSPKPICTDFQKVA